MGAKDLALPGAKIHLIRRLGIYGHAKGGALGRYTLVEPLPGLAQVGGPHHSPFLAAEVQTHAGIEGVWVVGRRLDAPGILNFGDFAEIQILPGLANIFRSFSSLFDPSKPGRQAQSDNVITNLICIN